VNTKQARCRDRLCEHKQSQAAAAHLCDRPLDLAHQLLRRHLPVQRRAVAELDFGVGVSGGSVVSPSLLASSFRFFFDGGFDSSPSILPLPLHQPSREDCRRLRVQQYRRVLRPRRVLSSLSRDTSTEG
jgi:hypothetical protein